MRREIFVTGGTGYLGTRLIPELIARGHRVRALVRPRSVRKLPAGAEAVVGDALDASSFADRVTPADTLVHLVGVSHPAPWKAAEFRRVDLASALATADAAVQARGAGLSHLVYLSVAHPAPVMRAYWSVRAECERRLAATGLGCTFVRPWYVLGPGHRWPYALIPFYAVAERIPVVAASARRLGLSTLRQTLDTLVWAIEHPTDSRRAIGVEEIKAGRPAIAPDGGEVLA